MQLSLLESLYLPTGYRPKESKGTIIRVPVGLTKEFKYKVWSANYDEINGGNVRVRVTPSADAVVGRYQLYVETKTKVNNSDKPQEFRYHHPEEFIVLFNPWCRGKCYGKKESFVVAQRKKKPYLVVSRCLRSPFSVLRENRRAPVEGKHPSLFLC